MFFVVKHIDYLQPFFLLKQLNGPQVMILETFKLLFTSGMCLKF